MNGMPLPLDLSQGVLQVHYMVCTAALLTWLMGAAEAATFLSLSKAKAARPVLR